jgi:hypothetical protein
MSEANEFEQFLLSGLGTTTITLPITGTEVTVRDITVEDKMNILKAVVTGANVVDKSIKLVRSLVIEPVDLNIAKLPEYDMNFLLAHVRIVHQGGDLDLETTCTVCKSKIKLKYHLGPELMNKYIEIGDKIVPEVSVSHNGVTVEVGLSNYHNRSYVEKNIKKLILGIGGDPETTSKEQVAAVFNLAMTVKRITIDTKLGPKTLEADTGTPEGCSRLVSAFMKLPQPLIDEITRAQVTNIASSIPSFYDIKEVVCQTCNTNNKCGVDLSDPAFFAVWH